MSDFSEIHDRLLNEQIKAGEKLHYAVDRTNNLVWIITGPTTMIALWSQDHSFADMTGEEITEYMKECLKDGSDVV